MCLDFVVDRFYLTLFSVLVQTKLGAFFFLLLLIITTTTTIIIIIITILTVYIYHTLINALSAHMIHINLKMKLYTHDTH